MQTNHDNLQPDVLRLADEINRYLHRHEFVADTLEGISQWWILRQRLQEELRRVELAMEYLCEQGAVEKRTLPDGVVLYSPALSALLTDSSTTAQKDTVKN